MISLAAAKQLALFLPESEEKSHLIAVGFEKPDFRTKNKVFAVLLEVKFCMVVKLSVMYQSVLNVFLNDNVVLS